MPVHFLAEMLIRLSQRVTSFEDPLTWVILVPTVLLLAVRTWSSIRTAPRLSADKARDLHGKLILCTGAFSPLGYTVFTRLATAGARMVALADTPVSAKDQQLLHLAQVASGNEELFIETCDISSITDIRRFASDWEKKAATRRGALGEEIGRQHLDTLLILPDEEKKDGEVLELVRALTPSIVKPTSVPGAPAGPTHTRVVYVLPSSFYAAADAPDYQTDGETWLDAQTSLHTSAHLLEFGRRREAEAKPSDGKLAVIAISPGTTRQFLYCLLSPRKKETLMLKIIPWSLMAALSPVIWAVGKSGSEAARSVEWAIRAPLSAKEPASASEGIQAGKLYRHTIDAGSFLRATSDEAVAKKLYEQVETRIEKLLEQEQKKKS